MSEKTFVRSEDVSTQVFDWGTIKWMSRPDVTGSERFSAGIVNLDPGRGHELHTHPDSDELLFVISGTGEQIVGDETREIGPGELVYVPENVEHGTMNTGWETLQLLAVYAPAGPEEVLADLPDCEIVPPGEIPSRS
ncbi:cupin domain-containing protein [Natrarchaeobius oligotrophus]|uniref:Cupin domain-containing protein n=1 Tax=Natrarchaeobius chitinivorans TaxID=1679083 RepID=A0A3N6PGJ0_NATCH|nr:cupin domain-containing protein [Natrarchaeobius chitinivorans]RQG99409.1 cupin domain-containing protein [Natrarchaeobius chitinivorans]